MFGFLRRGKKPRRLKLHDVQAVLDNIDGKHFSAHLWQTRWSDGTGKQRLWLPKLRDGGDRTLRPVLFLEESEVAVFPLTRGELDLKWQGLVTPEMPKFDIGQKVRLEVAAMTFEGTVEVD